MMKVHQGTVDSYLEDIILSSTETTADEQVQYLPLIEPCSSNRLYVPVHHIHIHVHITDTHTYMYTTCTCICTMHTGIPV